MIKSTDSLIALTARFLREKHVMHKFYANIGKNSMSKSPITKNIWKKTNGNIQCYLTQRLMGVMNVTPLSVAMPWVETTEGYDFWFKINIECKRFIESFIKCRLDF